MTFTIIMVILVSLLLLKAGWFINKLPFRLSKNEYIDYQIKYQPFLLLSAALLLFLIEWSTKQHLWWYFSIGNIDAPTAKMALFGIQEGDHWMQTGLSLCLVISLVTGIFMYFQLKRQQVNWSILVPNLGWILLFALSNAIGEEAIFRLGIVGSLSGIQTLMLIFFISGILFGIPHYWGMPSGIIGAILAGVLGYVLAKSVYETGGLFWACTIHFLQDVIIMGSLLLIKSK